MLEIKNREAKLKKGKAQWQKRMDKNTVAKYEMNTQDSDWLAATRLKKTVASDGIGAKAAQQELDKMENTQLVRPKGM